ncbi:hypothetical protein STRTUCAR8_09764 [Streptomyces turgidiscabies Car8]|uniref:Uncharacterized protein n=1 Tax=Streptomyces turgidiscabies (strain Car8) TaxID=698760 RepID=L7FCN4_STRT8|nr:hypothetical protein STRTUCAR8_09764 [Streptomyces turgidiscabies Car8]
MCLPDSSKTEFVAVGNTPAAHGGPPLDRSTNAGALMTRTT